LVTYVSDEKYQNHTTSLLQHQQLAVQANDLTMAYKLTYFNGKGRAELIRLCFAAGNVKFEDERIEFDVWPKVKPTTPAGHLPILTIDGGTVISESLATARFAANVAGIAGSNNVDKAVADMIVDLAKDLQDEVITAFFEKDEAVKEEKYKKLKEEKIPEVLSQIEKIVKTNGSGFSVGKSLTWADLALFNLRDFFQSGSLKDVAESLLCKNAPGINAICDKVSTLPDIAKYIKARPQTSF